MSSVPDLDLFQNNTTTNESEETSEWIPYLDTSKSDPEWNDWLADLRQLPFYDKERKTVGRPAIPYSDWITVEKRRASEGVYAFYVRYKNEYGKLKVGFVDYMKITDFEKRFANNDASYQAYRQQLIAMWKAERKER
jgi:hypothetical protein